MKKFTIIFSLMIIASYAIAQVSSINYPVVNESNEIAKERISKRTTAQAAWTVTFDEDPAVWTIAHDLGDSDWNVADTTITPKEFDNDGVTVNAMWYYMGRRDVGEYSESGGKFAYFDVISSVLSGTETAHNSWVRFDDIDLSAVSNPKLTFYQNFKKLNSGTSYVDVSTNNGTNWTPIEVNPNVEGNNYGTRQYEIIFPAGIGEQADVTLRFRFEAGTEAVNGYGWMIDDLKIEQNPDVDVMFDESFCSFFNYVANDEDNFHISSHYGMIPAKQFGRDEAFIKFDASVLNKGNLDISIPVNVKVLDPDNTEIYNNSATSNNLSINTGDTIAIDESLILAADPKQGKYTIIFKAEVANDLDEADNVDTTYFFVTENKMGRDIDDVRGSISTTAWKSGGTDGDKIGTAYEYFYQTTITSIEVFIDDATTLGTAIVPRAYQFANDEWTDVSNASIVNITADMLGTWQTLTFLDEIPVVPEGNEATALLVAVEFVYNKATNDDNNVYIGYDFTVNAHAAGTRWSLQGSSNGGDWVYLSNWSSGGVAIRAIEKLEDNAVNTNELPNVHIYPNPSNGIFNVANAENSTVNVYNLVGQNVHTVSNISNNATMDISNLPEGNYIVHISNPKGTKVQKINVVK